jgi:hypothetical protein
VARQYSVRDFFRHMPNALLARYFAARGLFADLDFAAMKETQPDALLKAWATLGDDALRRRIEVDFREISELSDKGGLGAILDEAQFHLEGEPKALAALREMLANLPDHHSRAMVTFLDHPELWKGAVLFHHADSLSYWRKRKNLPRRPAAVDKASLELLAEKIKAHFRATDGRGRHCVVEPLRRGERDYFFAYPEDHSDRAVEWVGAELDWRAHNPAFEIVFVYSQVEGTLDVNARGLGKGVEALQTLFAQAILKLDQLPADPKDNRVYDLEPLARPDFTFARDADSGIGAVVVKRIRLSSTVRRGDRVTLEADPTANRLAVYDLMQQVGESVPLHLYRVTQVDLEATVLTPGGKVKTKKVTITHPNTCSLKHDEIDEQLRKMLVASNIEPRAPEPAAAGQSTEALREGAAAAG